VLYPREQAKKQVGGRVGNSLRGLPSFPAAESVFETLCYEFKCADQEGRHYIFYVNAATGQQEKILILWKDESGSLTL
jgi:hypothetical protein